MKKDLQSLIGKLNWCTKVVRGGRTFLRNLIDLLPNVKEQYHYVRLSAAAKSDIQWWIVGLSKFHGSTPFAVDLPLPAHVFATDACLIGGAGHYNGDWFYSSWADDSPLLANANINVLELQTVLLAAKRWGRAWSGSHVLVRSDNCATVASIKNTTTRSPDNHRIVKELFWLSVQHDFKLSAKYLPGKCNVLSDKLSRLHEMYSANLAHYLLLGPSSDVLLCGSKMSYASYVFLQRSWAVNWRC
jgi:hypothetical protein